MIENLTCKTCGEEIPKLYQGHPVCNPNKTGTRDCINRYKSRLEQLKQLADYSEATPEQRNILLSLYS